jgi:hypothetical protein
MHIYRFSRQGTVKKPTFIVRVYTDSQGHSEIYSTQHYQGKEAFELITKLHEDGFEEVETGDPYMYVMQKAG